MSATSSSVRCRAYLNAQSAARGRCGAVAVTDSKHLYKLAKDKHDAGTATGVDVLRAEVQLANDRQALLIADNELKQSLLALSIYSSFLLFERDGRATTICIQQHNVQDNQQPCRSAGPRRGARRRRSRPASSCPWASLQGASNLVARLRGIKRRQPRA